MLFQGTVWGPNFCNVFYEEARLAIQQYQYTEIVYADDLNAYRVFGSTVPNCSDNVSMDSCQAELHKWGDANQVAFDASKENKHVLS